MLYLSFHRFIESLPFLLTGIAIFILFMYHYNFSAKRFRIIKTNYIVIARVIVPINLLVAVTLDLYFLFRGSSIFAIPVPSILVLISFIVISFLISFTTTYTIINIFFLREDMMVKWSASLLTLSILGISIILILHFIIKLSLISAAPIISFLFAPIIVIAQGIRRFNPYLVISIPGIISATSIAYLVYAIFFFGFR